MFRTPRASIHPDADAAASCRAVARVVESYLDGECDSTTTKHVLAHLETCPTCAAETRTLEAIKDTLASGRCCGADPVAVEKLRAYARRLSAEDPRSGTG